MRKIIQITLFSIIALITFLLSAKSVLAVSQTGDCIWSVMDKNGKLGPPFLKSYYDSSGQISFQIKSPSVNAPHKVHASCTGLLQGCTHSDDLPSDGNGNLKELTWNFSSYHLNNYITLNVDTDGYATPTICTYTIIPSNWLAEPTPTPNISASCEITVIPPSGITNQTPIEVIGSIKNLIGLDPAKTHIVASDGIYDIAGVQIIGSDIDKFFSLSTIINSNLSFKANTARWNNGKYSVKASIPLIGDRVTGEALYDTIAECITSFEVCDSGCSAQPTITPTPTPIPSPTNPPICQACQRAFDPCADQRCKESCNFCATPIPSPTNFPPAPSLAPLCEQLPGDFVEKCKDCIDKPEDGGQGGIWTAVGCIPINPEIFIRDYIFKIGVGIAGGVAFLYFIFGVFQILTSAGNAEKIAQAKEIIMSAISGLLLIIFSILLLKVIGVDILRIPGFS